MEQKTQQRYDYTAKRIFNSRKKIPLNVQLEIPDNRPISLSFLLKFLPCEQIFLFAWLLMFTKFLVA